MARKRFSLERKLYLQHQIELNLASASDLASAYRSADVIDATCYNWRNPDRAYCCGNGRPIERMWFSAILRFYFFWLCCGE